MYPRRCSPLRRPTAHHCNPLLRGSSCSREFVATMSRHPTTQYHHYIPQFLLRRFAIAPTTGRTNGKNRRRGNADDKMVNAVDLTTDCPTIDTVPVRRIFGQQDMYKDVSKFTPKDQMHMEKKLGTIEQVAACIIARVVDAHIDPAGEWIARLRTIIYPPDVDWLFMNIRTMHLAFVTPSDPSDEFILTGNAFGIHEGPGSFTVNRFTGEETMTAYTEFHLTPRDTPRTRTPHAQEHQIHQTTHYFQHKISRPP
jgi:hypothetical protein